MFVTPVGSHGIVQSLRGLQKVNQNSRVDVGAISFLFFLYPAHSAFQVAQVLSWPLWPRHAWWPGHGPGAPSNTVGDQVIAS